MHIKSLLFFLSVLALVNAAFKSYGGYKVYKVIPSNEEEVSVLQHVKYQALGEFWDDYIAINFPSRIMVSAENQKIFLSQLNAAKIDVTETIADLQKTIEEQLQKAESNRNEVASFLGMTWDRYHSLTEIYDWLDRVQEAYPDVVTTVNWGNSNENRELKGIVLDFNPERENKLVSIIESTLHAREWITPATVTWIIKEFLTSNDEDVRAIARTFEWHILPIANPDGYLYSFTTERMWRKNRNTEYFRNCSEGINNDMSNGVDLNRNFDFQWMAIGASDDPCSNSFAGSAALSEPESRAIASYVSRSIQTGGKLIFYLAFHSFGHKVIIPFSHNTSPSAVLQVDNYANMFEIGARAAAKLEERFRTQYSVGTASAVLYPMSGTSFDWVKNETNVPFSYLLELRDNGDYGFLLPADQIIPNNLEIMDFLVEMDKQARVLGYYERSGASTLAYSFVFLVSSVILVYYV